MVWIYWILGNSSAPPSAFPIGIIRTIPCVCVQYTYRLIGWFRLYKSGACMFGLRIKRTWVILYKLHWQPFYLHTLFVSKMIVKWFIWCCVHTVCECVLSSYELVRPKYTQSMFDIRQTLTSNTCIVCIRVDLCLYMDVKSITERTA